MLINNPINIFFNNSKHYSILFSFSKYLCKIYLFNVKFMFKFLNHGLSAKEIHRFITFLGIGILLFIRRCPLKFLSGNKWWSTKVGEKLLPDLVVFSIFSPDIPLDFHESIWVALLKYLMYFSAGISAK